MERKSKYIEDLLADPSFIRWINEEADQVEIIKWEEWLRNDPANTLMYHEAIELYRSLRFQEEDADTARELNKLKKSLLNYNVVRKTRPRRASYSAVLSIAAVLLLVFMALLYSRMELPQDPAQSEVVLAELATGNGQMQRMIFPDGSTVILNANSQMTYPEQFQSDSVEFHLEGEAYFSIQSSVNEQGSKRVYTVHTADGVISVLGTSFNVNTRGEQTSVVLDQGAVNLTRVSDGIDGGGSYRMTPGEMASFSAVSESISVQNVRTDLYTSWIDLKWIFDETPLFEIANRIESTYGVNVIIKDENIERMRFSGTAPNQNLSVLLEGLEALLDVPIVSEIETITIGE